MAASWGPSTQLASGAPEFINGGDAGFGTISFGWDGGPAARRNVEFQACTIQCPEFQRCVPTNFGGRCETYGWDVSFVSPAAAPAAVAGPLQANVVVEVSVMPRAGAPMPMTVPLFIDGGVRPLMPLTMAGRFGATVTLSSALVGPAEGPKALVAGWPDAGVGTLSATTNVQWDVTGPTVVVRPQPGGQPWKKDEVVEVEVGANEALSMVALTVNGTPVTGAPMVARCSFSATCVNTTCRCYRVDLAGVTLNGLTGTVVFGASGEDVVRNPGTAMAVNGQVTRLRWTRDITLPTSAQAIRPVAVSRTGVVVSAVEERAGTAGRVVATFPDGGNAWEAVTGGTVTAGPVVGANDVWVGRVDGTRTSLQPIGLSSGTAGGAQCDPMTVNTFNGDMALATVTGGEVVMGIRNGRLESTRAGGCDVPYQVTPAPGDVMSRPALAVQTPGGLNVEAFVAYEGDTRLWKAGSMGASWMGQGDVLLPAGPQQTKALFFNGTGRVGGGGGGVGNGEYFMTSSVGNLTSTSSFNSLVVSNGGPASHGAGALFYGSSTGGGLGRIALQGNALVDGGVVPAGVGNLQGTTPVLGAGLVYAVGASGTLTVRRQADLTEVWSGSLGMTSGTAPVVAQPALDVYRDGAGNKVCPTGTATTRPALGVLYVMTKNGSMATLRAILVDSPGLDNTAPWPKYQRDNGNTGNINSDISPWTCP
jgi:hypothetical protein